MSSAPAAVAAGQLIFEDDFDRSRFVWQLNEVSERLASDRLVPDGNAFPPRRGMRPGTAIARGAPTELPLRHVLQPTPHVAATSSRTDSPHGSYATRRTSRRPSATCSKSVRAGLCRQPPSGGGVGRDSGRSRTGATWAGAVSEHFEGQSLRDCPSRSFWASPACAWDSSLRRLQRPAVATGPHREDLRQDRQRRLGLGVGADVSPQGPEIRSRASSDTPASSSRSRRRSWLRREPRLERPASAPARRTCRRAGRRPRSGGRARPGRAPPRATRRSARRRWGSSRRWLGPSVGDEWPSSRAASPRGSASAVSTAPYTKSRGGAVPLGEHLRSVLELEELVPPTRDQLVELSSSRPAHRRRAARHPRSRGAWRPAPGPSTTVKSTPRRSPVAAGRAARLQPAPRRLRRNVPTARAGVAPRRNGSRPTSAALQAPRSSVRSRPG